MGQGRGGVDGVRDEGECVGGWEGWEGGGRGGKLDR